MPGSVVLDAAISKVAQSEILMAISRVIMVLSAPVILTLFGWVANSIITLNQRVAVMEAARELGRVEISRRISDLEAAQNRDVVSTTSLVNRLGLLETAVERQKTEQEATRRVLDRLERYLDQRRGEGGPPSPANVIIPVTR